MNYPVFWVTLFLIASIVSVVLAIVIRRYLIHRQILLININDLVSADYSVITAASTVGASIVFSSRIIIGPLNVTFVNVTMFLLSWSWGVAITYVLTMTITRYLLIFHNTWLNEHMDQNLRLLSGITNSTFVLVTMISSMVWNGHLYQDDMFAFQSGIKVEHSEPNLLIPGLITFALAISLSLHILTEHRLYKMNRIGNSQGF